MIDIPFSDTQTNPAIASEEKLLTLIGRTFVTALAALAVTAAYVVVAGAPFPNAVGRLVLVSLLGVLVLSFTGEPTRYPSAILYLLSLGALLFTFKSAPSQRQAHP